MGKIKILFVDDEPNVLESLYELFSDTYDVITITNGEEAIKIIETIPGIAVVVSDQRMPIMRGTDVLKKIKRISPDTIRILLTGYSDMDAVLESVNEGEVFQYIRKPWDTNNIKMTLSLAAAMYCLKYSLKLDNSHIYSAVHTKTLINISDKTTSKVLNYDEPKSEFIERLIEKYKSNVTDPYALFNTAFCNKNGKPKVMVVDDDFLILSSIVEILSDQNEVITCSSAEAALDALNHGVTVAAIVSDESMPNKSGTEFLLESNMLAPYTPKMLMTGYTDIDNVIRLINEGQIFRYIKKPWAVRELREAISAATLSCKEQLIMELFRKNEILKTANNSA